MKRPERPSGPRRPAAGTGSGSPKRRPPPGPAARPRRAGSTTRGLTSRRASLSSFRLPAARLPRFTPGRAGALLGILAALGGIYGLAATPAFSYGRADIPDLRWTPRSDIETALGVPLGANLFRLTVNPLEARIRALPAVADATVSVSLPDTIVVTVAEREAILAWAVGESRLLVDREGVVFAIAEPGEATLEGLPLIADARVASAALAVGSRLDPVDLDAATRLASLVPADVGSVARGLVVTITDETGFIVGTTPASWVAIFGLYTPSLRAPEIIPGQVRLLRSLLFEREATVAQVILSDEENGTLIPKATPGAPAPTQMP